jgi:hypothetical protein
MRAELHGGHLGWSDVAAGASSPDLLTIVAPAIAVTAGVLALMTALINRRIANRALERDQRDHTEDSTRADPPRERDVLLPPRVPCFVDRKDAIRQAAERIAEGERVLAIEGGTGVGKSAVAAELVHLMCSDDAAAAGLPELLETHDFVWVDGHDACPTLADICQRVALLTGEQSLTAVAGEAKLPVLLAHLSRRKTVVLLDNVKASAGAAVEPLRELLRTVPSGTLVITALNTPHALHAPRVTLDDLELPHVLELVRYEARRLGLDARLFDEAFAQRLREAVGGNPRWIEQFMRTLNVSPLSVDELFEGLERGEAVRELLTPVWRELSAESRDVLAACACLRDPADAEQLRIACEMTRDELALPLTELIEMGFLTIVRSAGRPDVYACSIGILVFAAGETAADATAVITRRLAGHYVRKLTADPEDAEGAIEHIGAIKAVLLRLFDQHDDREFQALFASILDILYTLGLFDDRITTGWLAYESAVRADNHRGASLATDVLSSTYAARGEVDEAREAAALGLLAAERSGDGGERARQMRATALTRYKEGDAAAALAAMEGADALARGTGEREILVNVLGLRTVAHWFLGGFDASKAAAEQALEVCLEMGWHRATAYPLRSLAEVAVHHGDFGLAGTRVVEARLVATERGDRRQLARISLTAARMHLFAGKLRAASREASEAQQEAISLGLRPELREIRAIRTAAVRALWFPPLRLLYARRRPARFTDAPIGGD